MMSGTHPLTALRLQTLLPLCAAAPHVALLLQPSVRLPSTLVANKAARLMLHAHAPMQCMISHCCLGATQLMRLLSTHVQLWQMSHYMSAACARSAASSACCSCCMLRRPLAMASNSLISSRGAGQENPVKIPETAGRALLVCAACSSLLPACRQQHQVNWLPEVACMLHSQQLQHSCSTLLILCRRYINGLRVVVLCGGMRFCFCVVHWRDCL